MEMPLVSVIVLSYNSNHTIVETLNSIANQTYETIELIISDDYSLDNTLSVVKDWILENEKRFENIVLVEADKNCGIAANANKGILHASGEWIKALAADDCLLPNCILDNIKYLNEDKSIQLVTSLTDVYQNNFDSANFKYSLPRPNVLKFFKMSAKQQHLELLRNNDMMAGAVMINRQTLIENGGVNEQYSMLEDYPMWVKLTGSGIKINFIPITTFAYRDHKNSVSHGGNDYMNRRYFTSLLNHHQEIIFPLLMKHGMFFSYYRKFLKFYLMKRVINKGNNIYLFKNLIERVLLRML